MNLWMIVVLIRGSPFMEAFTVGAFSYTLSMHRSMIMVRECFTPRAANASRFRTIDSVHLSVDKHLDILGLRDSIRST